MGILLGVSKMKLVQLQSRRDKTSIPVIPAVSPDTARRFLGRWKFLRSEGNVEINEDIVMEFTNNGRLIYISESDEGETIDVSYQIASENILITTNGEEREYVKFLFPTQNTFVFDYQGSKVWFERV
jgi:hypothetical protein